jgi:hypothetical protein
MRVLGRFGAPSGNDLLLRWREVEEDCPAIGHDLDDVVADDDLASVPPSMRMSAVSSLKVACIFGPLLRFAFSVVGNGTRYPCRRAPE